MAKYRLSYFDFSGSRGEECRLALAIAGVDFEDNRLADGAWAALKPETPYGAMPVLETAGKPFLAQSNAILTYIGQCYGLLPKDPWDAARHIAVLESVEELRANLAKTGLKDPAEKKAAREEFAAGPLTAWATAIDRQTVGPFFGGAAISVADVKLLQIMTSFKTGVMDHIPRDVFQPFARLDAAYEATAAHPKIVEWRSRH